MAEMPRSRFCPGDFQKEEGGVQGDSQVSAWVGWVRMTLWTWASQKEGRMLGGNGRLCLGTWALRSLWVFLQPAGDLERGVGGPRVGSPGAGGVLCRESGKG